MIQFEFNSRSSGQGVAIANQIAKKHKGKMVDGVYKVKFDSPTDPDLERLYVLVKNLKGTAMSLNNGEIIDPGKLLYAVNCNRKIICKGMCTHVNFGDVPVDKFIKKNSDFIEDDTLYISKEKTLLSIAEFLEPDGDNQFKIKKSEFLEYFRSQSALEKYFCPNYNLFEITEEINKLPQYLHFLSQEEFEEMFGDTGIEERLLSEILINITIDSTLSTEDILKSAKALSLLSRYPRGYLLQEKDTFIYSFPEATSYILSRFLKNEAISEVAWSDDLIVTKHESLFCIKINGLEIYFQIFEDNSEADSILKDITSLKLS